jgi:replicative DNA polymerase I (EC 2.7.7.7)
MRTEFWLLDASYDVVGGVPEVRLWGVDREGRRIAVLDRSFRPYIYVLPAEGAEDSVARRIQSLAGSSVVLNV